MEALLQKIKIRNASLRDPMYVKSPKPKPQTPTESRHEAHGSQQVYPGRVQMGCAHTCAPDTRHHCRSRPRGQGSRPLPRRKPGDTHTNTHWFRRCAHQHTPLQTMRAPTRTASDDAHTNTHRFRRCAHQHAPVQAPTTSRYRSTCEA